MANLILENPDKNTKHFSDMMQRGHLVAMNVNDVEEDFQQFVAKFERLGSKFIASLVLNVRPSIMITI